MERLWTPSVAARSRGALPTRRRDGERGCHVGGVYLPPEVPPWMRTPGAPSSAYGKRSPFVEGIVRFAPSPDVSFSLRAVPGCWPYAPVLFDFIQRAMPADNPQSLTPDEVYALCTYLLHLNGIVPENAVMDAQSQPQGAMLNYAGFTSPDLRPDVYNGAEGTTNHIVGRHGLAGKPIPDDPGELREKTLGSGRNLGTWSGEWGSFHCPAGPSGDDQALSPPGHAGRAA